MSERQIALTVIAPPSPGWEDADSETNAVPSMSDLLLLLRRLLSRPLDVAASFCLSRSDVGPTPGRQNGVTVQGCEP
jgi:hypothetical protein